MLSLFFIERVELYRKYDENGKPVKGEYARIFEEEYRRAAKLPEYNTLFQEVDLSHAAEDVHNGYFSIDKKGGWTDTDENNQTSRENAERAYNLIMKDKEKLLSFETPLKFIFSHSALKEGWDNPNVFQICTLRDITTERERRQTIGRGLRLCVNQDGERLRGFEINTLTVVARESYEEFAANLQREIEEDTGYQFGIVEEHQFAGIKIQGADGNVAPLGFEKSKELFVHLKVKGYLDAKGKVSDTLRTALKDGTLQVPPAFHGQLDQITTVLKKAAGKLEIKKFETRDEQEVAGYAEAMETIFQAWQDIPITENHIKQLHRDLLRYSEKDERHRSEYKTLRNDVGAFDADGKMIGIMFETATPFDTPRRMTELVTWLRDARELKRIHPLLMIAVFVVVFLEIHPFQDGNGRLSRVLTTLLLLQAGYAYVPYSRWQHFRVVLQKATRLAGSTAR